MQFISFQIQCKFKFMNILFSFAVSFFCFSFMSLRCQTEWKLQSVNSKKKKRTSSHDLPHENKWAAAVGFGEVHSVNFQQRMLKCLCWANIGKLLASSRSIESGNKCSTNNICCEERTETITQHCALWVSSLIKAIFARGWLSCTETADDWRFSRLYTS